MEAMLLPESCLSPAETPQITPVSYSTMKTSDSDKTDVRAYSYGLISYYATNNEQMEMTSADGDGTTSFEYPFSGEAVIGRKVAACEIVINDRLVSRTHVSLSLGPYGDLYVENISANNVSVELNKKFLSSGKQYLWRKGEELRIFSWGFTWTPHEWYLTKVEQNLRQEKALREVTVADDQDTIEEELETSLLGFQTQDALNTSTIEELDLNETLDLISFDAVEAAFSPEKPTEEVTEEEEEEDKENQDVMNIASTSGMTIKEKRPDDRKSLQNQLSTPAQVKRRPSMESGQPSERLRRLLSSPRLPLTGRKSLFQQRNSSALGLTETVLQKTGRKSHAGIVRYMDDTESSLRKRREPLRKSVSRNSLARTFKEFKDFKIDMSLRKEVNKLKRIETDGAPFTPNLNSRLKRLEENIDTAEQAILSALGDFPTNQLVEDPEALTDSAQQANLRELKAVLDDAVLKPTKLPMTLQQALISFDTKTLRSVCLDDVVSHLRKLSSPMKRAIECFERETLLSVTSELNAPVSTVEREIPENLRASQPEESECVDLVVQDDEVPPSKQKALQTPLRTDIQQRRYHLRSASKQKKSEQQDVTVSQARRRLQTPIRRDLQQHRYHLRGVSAKKKKEQVPSIRKRTVKKLQTPLRKDIQQKRFLLKKAQCQQPKATPKKASKAAMKKLQTPLRTDIQQSRYHLRSAAKERSGQTQSVSEQLTVESIVLSHSSNSSEPSERSLGIQRPTLLTPLRKVLETFDKETLKRSEATTQSKACHRTLHLSMRTQICAFDRTSLQPATEHLQAHLRYLQNRTPTTKALHRTALSELKDAIYRRRQFLKSPSPVAYTSATDLTDDGTENRPVAQEPAVEEEKRMSKSSNTDSLTDVLSKKLDELSLENDVWIGTSPQLSPLTEVSESPDMTSSPPATADVRGWTDLLFQPPVMDETSSQIIDLLGVLSERNPDEQSHLLSQVRSHVLHALQDMIEESKSEAEEEFYTPGKDVEPLTNILANMKKEWEGRHEQFSSPAPVKVVKPLKLRIQLEDYTDFEGEETETKDTVSETSSDESSATSTAEEASEEGDKIEVNHIEEQPKEEPEAVSLEKEPIPVRKSLRKPQPRQSNGSEVKSRPSTARSTRRRATKEVEISSIPEDSIQRVTRRSTRSRKDPEPKPVQPTRRSSRRVVRQSSGAPAEEDEKSPCTKTRQRKPRAVSTKSTTADQAPVRRSRRLARK